MKRFSLVVAALLAGCAAGPDYHRPATPSQSSAEGAFVSRSPMLAPEQPLPPRWWQLYRDPNLDRLIADAFRANTDLLQAVARLERARAVLAEARSDRLPATLVSGGARYRRGLVPGGGASGLTGSGLAGGGQSNTSGHGGASGDAATAPRAAWSYSAGLDVAYEVDLFGRVSRAIEAANADLAAQAAATDAVRVTVAAETARAYTGACAAGAQLKAARDGLRIAREQYAIARRQVELGALAQVELERLAAVVEQSAATLPGLENMRRAALFNLALLTGHAPGDSDAKAAACDRLPDMADAIPMGDGQALIARRPDIREAERRLAAATARIGVATAELYPWIAIGGSIVSAGSGLDSATSRQGVSFALGPLISWSFPNLTAARARIAQAEATMREALAGFDGAVLGALNEAERALSAYAAEADRNATLRRTVKAQARAFTAIQASARAGGSAPIDVLDTERELIEAQNELAASDTLLIDRSVDLFRALGGGWQDATPS
jgi:NodT family efflux transporter outer membrane factor (OMF) lipoprotein